MEDRKGSVMDDARRLWRAWQSLLARFAGEFTRPGWVRFVQWVTSMVLGDEEHTLTQLLVSIGLESRWRVLEHFAEYGAWDADAVERQTLELIEQERPARWRGYRAVAVDDTKLHRTSAHVWGTCTFHESSARSPNRAETVRAHNWVVAGDLLPGRPWTFLPHSARLYFRESQRPPGERFQTKTGLAVELLQQADRAGPAAVLAVFDGAYAMETVIRPGLQAGPRRIEFVTRLRRDARLYRPLAGRRHGRGRPRRWGERLAAPEHHAKWQVPWREGRAYLYGRWRKFRCKQVRCRWSVSGPDPPVHAFVFEVEGYRKPWFLVTSALDLSAAAVVEAFGARFRQEDTFRDHKQRLGMEQCRAWTKEPVLRTFQVQLVALTALRLLQFRLDEGWGVGRWWNRPAWNPHKRHPSVLDLRRLLWHHREHFSRLLVQLEEMEKIPRACRRAWNPAPRAA